MTAVLSATGLSVGYGSLVVARDIDLALRPGEVTVLLGSNGAGKTTTLLTLAGALPTIAGEVTWHGTPLTSRMEQRARDGLALVPDERGVIAALTVAENLRLGLGDADRALELFPELADHLDRRAGLLSGGQQKMLAVGLALSAQPQAVLADELSLGLAPTLVRRLLRGVRTAADEGAAVLLVEQHAHQALEIADNAVLLVNGRIGLSGPAADVRERLNDVLRQGYMQVEPAAAGASSAKPRRVSDGQLPAGSWHVDRGQSRVSFRTRKLFGLIPVRGRFERFDGELSVDAGGACTGRLRIDAASITTGNDKRDDHLRSAGFFHAESFPQLTFTLSALTPSGVEGSLRIRDKTLAIAAPATVTQQRGRLRIKLELVIDHAAAGLGWTRIGIVRGTVSADVDIALERLDA